MNSKDFFRLLILPIFLLISMIGYGQGEITELTGIVTSKNNTISNILIVNLNSKKLTITDADGFFNIEVKSQDTLQFSAVNYVVKEIIIDKIVDNKTIQVDLEEKVIDLEEVIILPHNLTGQVAFDVKTIDTKPIIASSSLGLPKANIKVRTKNERLLFQADDGKLIKYYGIGLAINTTKLINMISGRTRVLKDRVSLDEHNKIENEIDDLFSKQILSKELGIPEIKIIDFLNFCMNQPDFPKVSETINALRILEYCKGKSQEYKRVQGLD